MVIGKSGAAAYYLQDRFGHKLLKSVPASQLVHFYEKGVYKSDGVSSEIQPASSDVDSDEQGNTSDTCQCVHSPKSQQKTSTPKKDTGSIPSQIVIISSKELPVSSDESSTIDVGTEAPPSPINPWGEMDVNKIPIEIVDHFSDMEEDVIISESSSKECIHFNPLTDYERKVAALKFNLVITGTSHPVTYTGVVKLLSSTPVITRSALGNGACLFNSFSMLLTGRDTYSAIIHHICV